MKESSGDKIYFKSIELHRAVMPELRFYFAVFAFSYVTEIEWENLYRINI